MFKLVENSVEDVEKPEISRAPAVDERKVAKSKRLKKFVKTALLTYQVKRFEKEK